MLEEEETRRSLGARGGKSALAATTIKLPAQRRIPTCRKGAMLTDAMPSWHWFSSSPTPIYYLVGGKSTPSNTLHVEEYDRTLWKHDESSWTTSMVQTTSSALPPARWKGVFCKVDATRAVLFGGSSSSTVYLNDAWIYQANTGEWQAVNVTSSKPLPRRAHSGVVAGERYLIIFGGSSGEEQEEPLEDVWQLDLETNAWSQFASLDFPLKPRKGHTAVLAGRTMYVFGGRNSDSEYFDDLLALDFDPERKWAPVEWRVLKTKNAGPSKRNHHVSARIQLGQEEYILVYGGRSTHDAEGEILRDIWLYNIRKNTWKLVSVQSGDEAQGLPVPRIEAAYAQTERTDELIMGFGQGERGDLLNDLWTLRLAPVATNFSAGEFQAVWRSLQVSDCSQNPAFLPAPHNKMRMRHGKVNAGEGWGEQGQGAIFFAIPFLLLLLLALYRWRPNYNKRTGYAEI